MRKVTGLTEALDIYIYTSCFCRCGCTRVVSPIRMLPELSRAALWRTTMLRTNLSVCEVCAVVSSGTVGLSYCWTMGRWDDGT